MVVLIATVETYMEIQNHAKSELCVVSLLKPKNSYLIWLRKENWGSDREYTVSFMQFKAMRCGATTH